MAHVAQMLTQEQIYKPSSIFYFKPILLSAHKLTGAESKLGLKQKVKETCKSAPV